jgi:hypothetical protein
MFRYTAISVGAAIMAVVPAFANETLIVPFTQYDTPTLGLYDGVVHVTVSGVGQASGIYHSDAFYDYTEFQSPENRGGGWVMSYGLTTLGSFGSGGIPLSTAIVGGIPAYSASHVYDFQLDTGALTLTHLHFGIADDDLYDNSGAYTVRVATPELSTWTMMALGFAGLGFAGYRRTRAGNGTLAV